MTTEEITALPDETVAQRHDRIDEQDERFQDALHQLAARCGACGQIMIEEAGR